MYEEDIFDHNHHRLITYLVMGMKKMCDCNYHGLITHLVRGVKKCHLSQSPWIDHTFGHVGEAVCDHNHFRLIIIFVMCV